jgi:hypothetical protein
LPYNVICTVTDRLLPYNSIWSTPRHWWEPNPQL